MVVLGVAGYTYSDAENPVTALIPAGWGLLLLLGGAIAQGKPSARKHAMHAVAGLALLGLLMSGGRLAMVLASDKPASTLGTASLAGMAIICGVLLALCVKSFIDARRAREKV